MKQQPSVSHTTQPFQDRGLEGQGLQGRGFQNQSRAEHRTPNWLTIISLLAALFAPALVVAQLPSWRDAADGQTGRDERYRDGQRALDAGRYTEAAAAFATVAEENTSDSDAARYWQAWAAFKAGNTGEARRALVRLRKDHPDSAWLDDADSLEAEIRGHRRGGRDRGANEGPDDASPDALKLYALNSLMNSDSPQAVDAVVRLLDSTDDPKLRDRALFVLAQSDSAKAAEVLAEIARGTRTPGLQRTAVRYLGMSETDANLALLQSVYEATNDSEVKEAVIEAYFLADDEERLHTLATRETNPDLTLKAIHKLGLIDATETLHGLYETANTETKSHILHALFLADDDDFLAQVARTESDPELKQAAIHNLGLVGDTDALHDLYAVSDNESKARILHALFLADDDDFLAQVARTESDPDLKQAAIHSLGLVDATDELRNLYAASDDETKALILHALFLADDDDFLAQVARTESDPELKQAAIHSLGLVDATDTLRDLYGSATDSDTRDAILHALFLADDGEGLVALAKKAGSATERRSVVEKLSLMGDDEDALAYLLDILEQ